MDGRGMVITVQTPIPFGTIANPDFVIQNRQMTQFNPASIPMKILYFSSTLPTCCAGERTFNGDLVISCLVHPGFEDFYIREIQREAKFRLLAHLASFLGLFS
jgi:hypothetical protein